MRYSVSFEVISDIESLELSHDDILINYSEEHIDYAHIKVHPAALLFDKGIQPIPFHIHRWKRTIIPFYNQPGHEIPFDIFSAVFFYLSRYEEYSITNRDKHNRIPVEETLSYKYSSIHQPVVDIWLRELKKLINKKGKCVIPSNEEYRLLPTIDIDLLYKYLHKKPVKQIGGALQHIIKGEFAQLSERISVLRGHRKDPFHCFDEINDAIVKAGLSMKYFLLTVSHTDYDKMHDLKVDFHQNTIRTLNNHFPVYIHPSYYSNEQQLILSEKKFLEKILGEDVMRSRQHFIKLDLPHTYRQLIDAGIYHDYSMGYPQCNGFRAGTSRSFYWYDLLKEEKTILKIHPYSWMDATALFYEKKKYYDDLKLSWERIHQEVLKTDGIMCPIFHNYILGDKIQYPDFMPLFKFVLSHNSLV